MRTERATLSQVQERLVANKRKHDELVAHSGMYDAMRTISHCDLAKPLHMPLLILQRVPCAAHCRYEQSLEGVLQNRGRDPRRRARA
jgi:hypothetical protein